MEKINNSFSIYLETRLAQWIARSTSNRKVVGSSPTVGIRSFFYYFIKTPWFLTANFIIAYIARGREFESRPFYGRVAQW